MTYPLIQAVCDHKLKIRHLLIGYPGSVHDARMYANSDLSQKSENYFSDAQWLAGDSAYRLTDTVLTPYRKNSTFRTYKQRQTFNKYFSSYRVRIENCFGILKEKFSSLKELRIRIHDTISHQYACSWILTCCVLHNIILPTLEQDDMNFYESEDLDDEEEHRLRILMRMKDENAGEVKREALFNMVVLKK